MTAKNKLLASIVLLIMMIISLLSIIGYYQINGKTTQESQYRLSVVTQLITSALEQKIDLYFASLSATASALVVENDVVNVDKRTINMLISEKGSLNVSNYFLGLPDGSLYDADSHGLHPTFNAKDAKREWFIKGMMGKGNVVTTPFKATTGEVSISLVSPVKRNGKVIAMVGVSLLVDDLTNYINQLSSEGNVFVAREDGFLLAAYDNALVGENLFELRPSYRQYVDLENSAHSYHVPERGDFYVVSQKSRQLGWTIWGFEHWDTITAASRENVITNLLSGLVFIVLGAVGVSVLIQKLMYVPLGGEPKEIECLVKEIASGNLTDIPQANEKSVGIYRSTLEMGDTLRAMISEINLSAQALIHASQQLEKSSLKVDDSSRSQMMQLDQVAASMEGMTTTVSEVAQSAVEASHYSNSATTRSSEGLFVVAQMNEGITHLVDNTIEVQQAIRNVHTETENVAGILDVIRGIADQTNLLALNAAIEAARAGEHGRGFAVVADEVRSLATRTQQSTNEIQAMIEALQQQASNSVSLMESNAEGAQSTLAKADEAKKSLEIIQNEIRRIQDMNTQIATAAEQQSLVANEINASIIMVSDLARGTSQEVQENVNTSESLNTMALGLKKSVNIFKL